MRVLRLILSRRLAISSLGVLINGWIALVCFSGIFGGLLLSSQPVLAQSPLPPAQALDKTFQDGMAAFQAGDFPAAIAALSIVAEQAEASPAQMEPVIFTLGAAYFNAKDYKNAILTLQAFLSKYPQSLRAPEATFALAQSQFQSGDTASASQLLKSLEANPQFSEQALLFRAGVSKTAGQIDDAISALEKLVGGEIKTKFAAKGAMQLAAILIEKGMYDKALSVLAQLERQIALVENIVGLNALAGQLGDKLLAEKAYDQALACYRKVRSKEAVVKVQRERIAEMGRQIDANLVAMRANPQLAPRNLAANEEIRANLEEAKQLLEEFEKLPSIQAAVFLRMARCFYEDQKQWEAILVYEELLKSSSDAMEREPALYALVTSYAEVGQRDLALGKADEYLKEFPAGTNVGAVTYLQAMMALQNQNYAQAETLFGYILENQPQNEMREQIRLLLGNVQFGQGKYEEAVAQYQKYLTEYPSGINAEEAEYRIAMARLFAGKYEDAFGALTKYTEKFPSGAFVEDAKYRLAVCKYAAQDYDQVVAACEAWANEYPGSEQLGEVDALLGDAFAAKGQTDEALAAYTKAYKAATTDEVLNYALFEASKILQKKGDWENVSAMFEEFVKENPEHPTVVAALFWIGKAKARMGRADEAKQFFADTIKKYIDDPSREAVEQMLTQLVQLCVKKPRTASSDATATPSPAPVFDPSAELDKLLGFSAETATAKARVLFAKSELARLRKQSPEQERNLQQIVDSTKPEALSPGILGPVGDFLLSKGKLDQAQTFYVALMDSYPKSEVVDFAYSGLGEIAYRRGDFPLAYKFFNDGTVKIAAAQKLRDVTLGRGKALLALGRDEEAKKLFEQVASVREWRGEATAESVYSLGEIEAKRGRWAEANAYFQRVFVAYRKFLPWVAKAYVKSAECLEKLGKSQEALNTYNELLRQENLATMPEAEIARQRVKEMAKG